MSTSPISIRVLLFARYAEVLGQSELMLQVPHGATVSEVMERVRAHPGGSVLPPRMLVARGLEQVDYQTTLAAGDELAVLPPMSGG
ncbi:MAG TPA: MoaD/ThiS family protein [Gemmatimonadales bacterium]|nr:MoaD/ThiS family protein [Gemmatimonadales bacterium]